jgi:hypothetical protein
VQGQAAVSPFAFLSKWARARGGCPFSGIARSVDPGSVRWDGPQPPFTVDDLRDITKRLIGATRYRAPLYPPGWTMTELGMLPPGWTVRNGKPMRPP